MFVSYWFVMFASIFFSVYWFCAIPKIRKIWLLVACMIFHYRFAGPAGVIPIIFLGIITYFAGIYNNKNFRMLVIVLCILELIFYKYTVFLITQIFGFFSVDLANNALEFAKKHLLPQAPPLAISFFVFEFVHYLTDLHRGKKPIHSVTDFTLFSIFWPSVVSGPIKRFEQFLPSIAAGCNQVNSKDIQIGMMRIVTGLVKKLIIADNLTIIFLIINPIFQPYLMKQDGWFSLLLVYVSYLILVDIVI